MAEQKIKYLEHPVTPEEKQKWRDKGFKIIDKQFEPSSKESSQKDQVNSNDAPQ